MIGHAHLDASKWKYFTGGKIALAKLENYYTYPSRDCGTVDRAVDSDTRESRFRCLDYLLMLSRQL